MFKEYNTTSFTELDAWKTKIKVITQHRGLEEIDYDMLEGTYDLEKMFNEGMSPRQAVEAMAKDIFS